MRAGRQAAQCPSLLEAGVADVRRLPQKNARHLLEIAVQHVPLRVVCLQQIQVALPLVPNDLQTRRQLCGPCQSVLQQLTQNS